MATAEELLNSISKNQVSVLSEDDGIFVIDGESRTITVPDSERLFGVEGDKDVERKYFQCPKIVGDNIDLSQHQIYVSYVFTTTENNTSFPTIGNGLYHCEDVEASGDNITFSWLLSGNVFANPGFIAFKVMAKKSEGGELKTKWNTAPAIGTVLLTVPDGDALAEQYPDVFNQILDRLDKLEENGGGGSYTLPIMSDTQLGGGKAVSKTDEDVPVAVDTKTGQLFVPTYPVQGGITEEQKQQLEQNTQDITDLKSAMNQKGLPSGGTAGQVLAKKTNSDFDVEWKTVGLENLYHVYNFSNYGEIFSNELAYQAWPLQVVQYDALRKEIVCLVKENDKHVNPTKENLYILRMKPENFEVTFKKKIYDNTENQENSEAFKYMRGFCVVNGIYYKGNFISGNIYMAKSEDGGENWITWTPTITNSPSKPTTNCGLLYYNNGRFIFESFYNMIAYSDDNMETFTFCDNIPPANEQNNVQSECDIIPNGNNLMRIMRHSWSSTDTTYYNGKFKNEPADISYSYDNGATWTETKQSKSILDMSANNCCHVISNGYVHLFVGSRRPYLYDIDELVPYGTNTKRGHIEYYIATIDDAFNDNFTHIKTIVLSDNMVNDNFNGVGCCKDDYGTVHIFYGDGNLDENDYSRWNYLCSSDLKPSFNKIKNEKINDIDLKNENQAKEIYAYMKSYVTSEFIKYGLYPDDWFVSDGIECITNMIPDNYDLNKKELINYAGNRILYIPNGVYDSSQSESFKYSILDKDYYQFKNETSEYTIEFIFKGSLYTFGSNNGGGFNYSSGGNSFISYRRISLMKFKVNNGVAINATSSSTYDYTDGKTEDENGYTTVSFALSSDNSKCYLNGIEILNYDRTEEDIASGYGGIPITTREGIKAFSWTGEGKTNKLVQVRIYNKKLSSEEIIKNKNAFNIYSSILF